MQLASFHKELTFNDKKPALKVLLNSDFSKEIRILMKKGQVMKEHSAPLPIVVQVLSGDIDFGVNGEVHHLEMGDLITLAAGVPHDLKAQEDSIIRLSILKKQ